MHSPARRRFGRFATIGCVLTAGAIAPSTALAADTTAPTAPTNLLATPASGQVSLSWRRSTDNVGVTGYNVWRRLASAAVGTGWSQVGKTTTAAYVNSGLQNGTSYVYAIRAVDAASNVSGSSGFATSTAGGTTPSPTPTPQPPSPTSTPTGASFDGSMESGLTSNFALVTEMGASPAQRITGTVRRGTYASSMTVKSGQKRSELQANAAGVTLKVMPGTTAWFADSIYLAPGFPTRAGVSNGWQTVLQWKDAGGTQSSSPPVSLDIKDGAYTLYGGWGCPGGAKQYRVTLAPATTGSWIDFEFQIHFDSAGKGWIDSYVNGKQVGARITPPCGTTYPSPYAKYDMLRVGYYRDPSIATTGTIIHDEYRMGATRSSVSLYG